MKNGMTGRERGKGEGIDDGESDCSAGWFVMQTILFLSSPSLSHRIIFRGSLRWDLSSLSSHTHTHT